MKPTAQTSTYSPTIEQAKQPFVRIVFFARTVNINTISIASHHSSVQEIFIHKLHSRSQRRQPTHHAKAQNQHVPETPLPHPLPPPPPTRQPPISTAQFLIQQPNPLLNHSATPHHRPNRRHPQPHRLLLRRPPTDHGPRLRLRLPPQLPQRPPEPHLHARTGLPVQPLHQRQGQVRSQRQTGHAKHMSTIAGERADEVLYG